MAALLRIISGGQTGADRGGLDAALALGLGHGGHCPRGRLAEDGVIPARYHLTETEASDYDVRTERNVVDGDGTVLFTHGPPTGGSALTAALARRYGKPLLALDLARVDEAAAATALRTWLAAHTIATLNVAGSRASKAPGLATAVERILVAALR
jgi:hypothetical protein